GAAATWWVRPWYQATASIIISHPSLHAAELTPVEYPPPVDPDREMQTELIILSSRAVGDPVIASLNLEQRDPEIQAAIAQAQRRRARSRHRRRGRQRYRRFLHAPDPGRARPAGPGRHLLDGAPGPASHRRAGAR